MLVDHFYWGSVFVVSGLLAAVALLAVIFLVPSTRAAEQIRLDPLGAVLAAVGIGSLVLAIIEGPDRGWTDPLTVVAVVAGVVLIAGFVVWELRNRYPMVDPRLFRHRGHGHRVGGHLPDVPGHVRLLLHRGAVPAARSTATAP